MTVRRPLKINGSSGLIEMSDADLDYVSYVVRHHYSRNEDSGWLRINSNPSGYTSIGSYTDQARSQGRRTTDIGDVYGTGPSNSNVNAPGSESNVTYTFYQNYNDNAQEPGASTWNSGPLVADNGSYSDLVPLGYVAGAKTIADVYDTVIDPIIQDIEGGGMGFFKLATSTPTNYTTTGYSAANRVVTAGSTAGPSTTTTTLFVRTTETAPTTSRPVMWDSDGVIKEMSDQAIVNFFLPFLRNRINEGSRLVYTFGTSATGIDAGSLVNSHYTGSTNASSSQLISGHTYYRDVSSLSSTTLYLRLANT